MAGYFAALLMYLTWQTVYVALSGKKLGEEGGYIAVFFIVLTQFFMSWVPRLRQQPLTFKTFALKWLLLPIIYVAIMSALMQGIAMVVESGLDQIW